MNVQTIHIPPSTPGYSHILEILVLFCLDSCESHLPYLIYRSEWNYKVNANFHKQNPAESLHKSCKASLYKAALRALWVFLNLFLPQACKYQYIVTSSSRRSGQNTQNTPPKTPGEISPPLFLKEKKNNPSEKSCWLYFQNLPLPPLQWGSHHCLSPGSNSSLSPVLPLSLQSILNPATRVILLQFMSNHVISELRTLQLSFFFHSEEKPKALQ